MKKYSTLLLCLFLLAACGNNGQNSDQAAKDETDNAVQGDDAKDTTDGESGSIVDADNDVGKDSIPLISYFMKDGTVAHFEGQGNEYATFTRRTQYLNDNYVNIYEDNGGTVMLSTYRIEEDQILLVWQESERYEDYKPGSELELESLEPINVYLKAPLEKGTKFDGSVVTDTQATVGTPYKTFENVLVTEQTTEDGITRRYFAEGFGEIKREIIMKVNGTETTVTSTLSKIE